MEDPNRPKEKILGLLATQRLAVLATHGQGQPYGSIVSFASTPDGRQILFATSRSTRKYENLKADPRVALVIDNRSNRETDFQEAVAVTATGRAEEVPDAERAALLELYLDKHPYLADFVTAPTCALLRVRVETYYLVSRFQQVEELSVDRWS
jgi:nitroimidazol reductase NimA-like FMN-containing flavoprotein (pyridoxamine 5'-phosphate oxidase superfamily)